MVGGVIVALVALLSMSAAQDSPWWNWGPGIGIDRGGGRLGPGGRGIGGGPGFEYQTCLGKNSDGDSMRITFSHETNNNPWGGNWGPGWGRTFTVRLSSEVMSSRTSTLSGVYQLVVTEGSRTEQVCLSNALGSVIGKDRNGWISRREAEPRGYVGDPFIITNGQTAVHAQPIRNLIWDEIVGRGVALCRSDHLQGAICMDVIPLCCKLGFDRAPATVPITRRRMAFMGGLLQGQLRGIQQFQSNQNGMNFGMGNGMGGGLGSNAMTSGFGSNTMTSGFGSNTMTSGFGSNTMTSGFGSNSMTNGFGSNPMTSGFGSNAMTGGFGSNAMAGGFGSNAMTSGFGSNGMGGGIGANGMGGGMGGMGPTAMGGWLDPNGLPGGLGSGMDQQLDPNMNIGSF